MNRQLLSLALSLPLLLSLSGCFEKEVSCSSEDVSKLLEAEVIPFAKKQYIANVMEKEHSFSSLMFSALVEYEKMGMGSKDPSQLEGYEEAKEKMEKAFKGYKFILHDIRTTDINEKIHKVACIGYATVKTTSSDLDFSLDYQAQIGDDKKTLYVDILDIKPAK